MDFEFSDEEKAFREEVSEFIKKEAPPDWTRITTPEDLAEDEVHSLSKTMARKLGEKGWLGMSWPREYGGRDVSLAYDLILREELYSHGLPGIDSLGLDMLAPVLLRYGTEEQRRRHLIPMAEGKIFWCEGFSEPNAGSDVAAVQLKAIEHGDSFILDGQKTWTSEAQWADWGFFLVLTDPDAPKHKGLSILLMDMKSPGITVQPIMNIAGNHNFCEVYFDDVRVPKKNLLGERNQGWLVSMAVLDFERSILIIFVGIVRRLLDLLVRYIKEQESKGSSWAKDPIWRHELADIAIGINVGRLLIYRVAWQQSKGIVPSYEAEVSKVFCSELLQQAANTGMRLLGAYGQLMPDSKWAPLYGVVSHLYLNSLAATIWGGTSEIERNVIAIRGLGLPRG